MRQDVCVLTSSQSPNLGSLLLLSLTSIITILTRIFIIVMVIICRKFAVMSLVNLINSQTAASEDLSECSTLSILTPFQETFDLENLSFPESKIQVYQRDNESHQTYYRRSDDQILIIRYDGTLSRLLDQEGNSDTNVISKVSDADTVICGDFEMWTWIFSLSILCLSLFLPLIVSFLSLIAAFKTKVFSTSFQYPLLLMSGVLCHLTIGRVFPCHVSLSTKLSILQIMITFIVSAIVIVPMATVKILMIPMIISTSLLAMCLLLSITSLWKFTNNSSGLKIIFKTDDLNHADTKLSRLI